MTQDTPVYVPTISPNFFDCAQSAADAAWDGGEDPTAVKAYVCTVGKAYVPHLVSIVEEAWYEEYDDPDAYDIQIPEPLYSELIALYDKLVEAAPTVWTPTNTVVVLPAIDCPECGRYSHETWPEDVPDCDYCGRPNEADEANKDDNDSD